MTRNLIVIFPRYGDGMHIRDWPRDERPREKLLKQGAIALSDAELLALFLGSGLRGEDAVATARGEGLGLRAQPRRCAVD